MNPAALPVLTAVTGPWESALVTGLEQHAAAVVVVRRCADLADLLATAATGQARAVVVSADLRRLDADALSRLASGRVAVVALVEPGDEGAHRRLQQLGVDHVLPADAPAARVAAALTAAALTAAAGGVEELAAVAPEARSREVPADRGPDLVSPAATGPVPAGSVHATARAAYADPRTALSTPRRPGPAREPASGDGQVVAVWGPAGSPGRTTTAVGLAVELGRADAASLLVDADTYAASIAQVLGLLDEAPGLASAARAADHGALDLALLSRLAPSVTGGLRVLTGIASAQRWPELRPSSLTTVLRLARSLSPWTVVDVASCLEQDEELSYDTAAPRRNGATLAVLAEADVVLAVGSADPVGLHRLVRGLAELAAVAGARPVVVVNRVRPSGVGPRPDERVRQALERYAGVVDAVLVPDDPAALDLALLRGRTLAEVAGSSRVRAAMVGLADRVAGRRADAS